MNQQAIAGFLLFKKPNQYTIPSTVSPGLFILPLACQPGGASRDESFAIGTRCGSVPFHQGRVDEYIAFKRGQKSMIDLIFANDSMLTLAQYNMNWRFYHNRQMKRWFGDDLVDMY
jgi:hypothetical protein